MSFQTAVNQQPAPAVAGDFASTNPRSTVIAGPGGLVAGTLAGTNPTGLLVGRFAWVDVPTGTIASNSGAGAPNGFVHNAHNALITQYLGETSLSIPTGFPVTLFRSGDFWVKNDSTGPAYPGQKVYASNATGQATSFGATGLTPTGGSGTASSIAAGAGSVTASIAIVPGNTGPGTNPGVMTVTVVGSGSIQIGGVLSGTGVVTGTTVTGQLLPLLAGEALNGVGRYYVSIPQTVAATTITEAHGVLTVGGTVTGTFAVGDSVNGSGGGGVTAGTIITALGTGVGGAGTYIVNLTQTVTSSTINAQGGTETAWYCHSFGQAGELVKISTSAQG